MFTAAFDFYRHFNLGAAKAASSEATALWLWKSGRHLLLSAWWSQTHMPDLEVDYCHWQRLVLSSGHKDEWDTGVNGLQTRPLPRKGL